MSMSMDFFLNRNALVLSSWRLAFPELACHSSSDVLPALSKDALVWCSTEFSGWQDAVQRLASRGVRVIVLSSVPSQEEGLLALERGARGYCHALGAAGLLREVALVVRYGGLWVGPDLLARAIRAAGAVIGQAGAPDIGITRVLSSLSEREREVAFAVAEGLSNKSVAQRLGITERTVKAHLSAVFDKFGVRDRMQLALRISQRGA